MNPFDLLTSEDKQLIEEYIFRCTSVVPMNLETILASWNKSKRTLCKALGGQLRVKIPIDIKMSNEVFVNKLREVYHPISFTKYSLYNSSNATKNHPFIVSCGRYFLDNFKLVPEAADWYALEHICDFANVKNGVFTKTHIFTHQNGKQLKIPEGTKVMRGIRKILEFYGYPDLHLFGEWRDAISVVSTTKQLSTYMVFSIHPIDFFTMSDNTCHWTSCMSWLENGGYSTGVLEMLNSNIAMVCYLESSQPFIFNDKYIPNKNWRSLIFAHKNILLVGKPYPYYSEEIALKALELFQKIVKKNLGWEYQYQYQKYQDLRGLYTAKQLTCFPERKTDKHRIRIAMYPNMYHDMIEDQNTVYWCCRNWVKKDMIISASGLATCLCCGKPLAPNIHNYGTEGFGSRKYCDDCFYNHRCGYCKVIDGKHTYYQIFTRTSIEKVCKECLLSEYFYLPQQGYFVSKEEYLMWKGKMLKTNKEWDYSPAINVSEVEYIDEILKGEYSTRSITICSE